MMMVTMKMIFLRIDSTLSLLCMQEAILRVWVWFALIVAEKIFLSDMCGQIMSLGWGAQYI